LESKGGTERKREGLVFIISAPSGTGKTSLVKRVIEELPNLTFSVSYTTRPARANEREGEDYHFVSPSTFEKMVEKGRFLEWAEVLGNRYGTAWTSIETLTRKGMDLILDIDTQGARKVAKEIDRSVLIFILPPSPEALRERLVKRGLETPDRVKFRLASARREIEESCWYQYAIVNESIEDAVEKLKAIIIAERCRKSKEAIVEEKKRKWEENYGENHCRGLSENGGEPL
jgi:guanylate kinase